MHETFHALMALILAVYSLKSCSDVTILPIITSYSSRFYFIYAAGKSLVVTIWCNKFSCHYYWSFFFLDGKVSETAAIYFCSIPFNWPGFHELYKMFYKMLHSYDLIILKLRTLYLVSFSVLFGSFSICRLGDNRKG